MKKLFSGIFVSLFLLATSSPSHAEEKILTIGTGSVTGVYYPTGGAICRLINKDRKQYGFRCAVESTAGSITNLENLRNGDLDIAIVQSDWQYHAVKGSSKFKEAGADKELRSLFSVYSEPLTIVARTDSGIENIYDLKGKRVNLGPVGSGPRGTMEVLLRALDWTTDDFSAIKELPASQQVDALCSNKVDAVVFTAGHPNGAVLEATNSCDTTLVEVSGSAVDKLVEESPFYAKTTIPGGMYEGTNKSVSTFGVKATVVTTTRLSNQAAYSIVKAIFDNLKAFRELHPAFAGIKKESMAKDGNTAPLHDGAIQYFNEKGMM